MQTKDELLKQYIEAIKTLSPDIPISDGALCAISTLIPFLIELLADMRDTFVKMEERLARIERRQRI